MLNIAVVPCFQKPWVLTSALNSAGTCTCTGCPTILAAPLTVLYLPPWSSPTVFAPQSAAPPPCHAPALILFPCTILLFIFGLYVIALGTRARAPRATHSFAASSYRAITRPPFGDDRACLIDNLLPQPSKVTGMSYGISLYLRRRLSRNSSQDNSGLLRRWGTELSQSPFLVALWGRFLSWHPDPFS